MTQLPVQCEYREQTISRKIEMIKKIAIEEITCKNALGWYLRYFDFENYRINSDDTANYLVGVICVDNYRRLLFGSEDAYRMMRYRIRLYDLTDEERKDLFDTIKTACDAVSL